MAVTLKDPQDGDLVEVSDINVTPFIDVILVLLIIFMVAAPLSTVDVAVNLPVSNAQPQPRPDKPVFLTVKQDLSLALGNEDVARETLQSTLDQQTGNDRDQRVFLRADGAVSYRDLMAVMNLLRDAGYLKIALVGLEDTGQGSGAAAGQPPFAGGAIPPATPANGAKR
ncbi:TonB system transport protein ExbD [Bradyrhizobium sp. dw_78]|uniref:TonB system transport protein ExbD n=1 Tax=Bradyrhizobium sp. dw_78 TaxID=2719793 RepID=UPI001BD388EA|nr:TonB system transport protein ExbD [Bradyrhizobium sp. dw_78]